ncbi:MAG: ribonuclease P protein component [Flavobacteriaceae bacterium]|nr:ribonuclease P protein component [Flavobacteriaceae bacterium]
MDITFSKHEKLKSKKLIDEVFTNGQSVLAYPLRMVFLETKFKDSIKARTSVSVSKRYFKKAVDRNYIKRLIREAYRINKPEYFNNIPTQHAMMILYLGKEKPKYELVEHSMHKLFKKFNNTMNTKP